jgi:nicotinamide mononucleotide transporter
MDLITANLELIGVLSGIATVYLAARNSIWNWPIGVASSVVFTIVFFQAGIYADSALQVFYVVTGLYGLAYWMAGGNNRTPAPVTYASKRTMSILAVLSVVGTLGMGYFLDTTTDSTVPYADGLTTTLSLVAQFLLMKRYVQNWWVWIFFVNIPYIFVYIYKDLQMTAALQVIYIGLSVMGWIKFRREAVQ